MATKDWKIAYKSNKSIKWFNKKNNASEVIIKFWENSDLWKVSYDNWDFGGKHDGKLVDTKSQALKFAKDYMRTH